MSDLVFMDTETLGTDIDSPIWEFAAIRRGPAGPLGEIVERQLHIFIDHDPEPWINDPAFPDAFKADYRARFDKMNAFGKQGAAEVISAFLAGKPTVIGAVPNFDTERINHQLLRPAGLPEPWHYHLFDVENGIAGYIAATNVIARHLVLATPTFALEPPWQSNDLSKAVGVDPELFDRHTAMGDVLWVRAQYDAVMGGGAE